MYFYWREIVVQNPEVCVHMATLPLNLVHVEEKIEQTSNKQVYHYIINPMWRNLLVKNNFLAQESSLPRITTTGYLDPLQLAY